MSTITRVGFCPRCELTRRPKTGDLFVAFGSTSKNYHLLEAERYGKSGFVPTIYKAKFVGENVIVHKACGMYSCGADKRRTKEGYVYFIREDSWKREVWTLETWNALVRLKHDEFTQMYEI